MFTQDYEIIGMPSGLIINVSEKELSYLMNINIIEWDLDMDEYIFKDIRYNQILRYLYHLGIGSGVEVLSNGSVADVVKIVKQFDGSDIMGKDVRRIFEIGDTIYVVRNSNGKIGMYKKKHLKKIREINEENI